MQERCILLKITQECCAAWGSSFSQHYSFRMPRLRGTTRHWSAEELKQWRNAYSFTATLSGAFQNGLGAVLANQQTGLIY